MKQLTVVLIETLWNVKSSNFLIVFFTIPSRINRNIVECKAGDSVYISCGIQPY